MVTVVTGDKGLYESSRYILVTLVTVVTVVTGDKGLYESSRYFLVTLVTVVTVVTGDYISLQDISWLRWLQW